MSPVATGSVSEISLRVKRKGFVMTITLNRPEALNTLNLEAVRRIRRAMDEGAASDGVRLILIRGAGGRAFCAGGDIKFMSQAVRDKDVDRALRFLRQEYDLDLLIQALPPLIETIPDARLIIVGDGDGLPSLRTQVEQAGLTDRVVFTGRLAPDRAAPLLRAADVAVAPYRDTLINRSKCAAKIIYYMAMGKPIVSSRVGQNLEYLDGGLAGLLTEPGDAADLAAGLVALLRDPERAAELARRARQRIWEQFDWRKQISQVEQAYDVAFALHSNPQQP